MITKVRLLKTLKAGNSVWVEGTILPNLEFPSIPADILNEVRYDVGTVEVLETKKAPPIPIFEVTDEFTGTTASSLKTSNEITPLTEEERVFEAETKELPHEEEKKAPEKLKKKSSKKPRSKKKTKPKLSLKVKR